MPVSHNFSHLILLGARVAAGRAVCPEGSSTGRASPCPPLCLCYWQCWNRCANSPVGVSALVCVALCSAGKSKILRSLNKTYAVMGRKPLWVDLNPKAITTFELFGYINPATREWKDGEYHAIHLSLIPHSYSHPGLFSSLMRDLSEKTSDSPKWIVLDGDIDPMWIESLNTVMDDNKVRLTPKCHSCYTTTYLQSSETRC